MTLRFVDAVLRLSSALLLRLAAWLVPHGERVEWLQEWNAEVWHARHHAAGKGGRVRHEWQLLQSCYGAFEDALFLRRGERGESLVLAQVDHSASRFLLVLAAIGTLAAGLGLLLPGVRAQIWPTPFLPPPDLVLVRPAAIQDENQAGVRYDEFKEWRGHLRVFASMEFYQLLPEPLPTELSSASVQLAVASPGLLPLLNLPLEEETATPLRPSAARLILSDEFWRVHMAADRNVLGRTIRVGSFDAIGFDAVIQGIAPPTAWRLPGTVDAWLLEPDASKFSASPGYVVGRLAPTARTEFSPDTDRTYLKHTEESSTVLSFVRLGQRDQAPWTTLLFGILLGCLCLPAITSLSFGDCLQAGTFLRGLSSRRPLILLAAQIVLLGFAVVWLALDCAYFSPVMHWQTAQSIGFMTSFSSSLIGLRWIWHDQLDRCPVCLGRLTHPARVGQPSRNFLSWNGIELICVSGHGLLYVPELSTSWCATQRWLCLDPSWHILFAE